MSRWSDDELDALGRLGPCDRAGMTAFLERFPHRSRSAARSKLEVLRIRRKAIDVKHNQRRHPFPADRFSIRTD
jgi:hypothetical protein